MKLDPNEPVFLESENSNIGRVNIPLDVLKQMENSLYIKINIPIEDRIKNLLDDYGKYPI